MEKVRDYYIDWIRVVVVMLLIPYHTAVSFSYIGNAYIYYPEPVDSLFFELLSYFLNLWFMRILFFISGFAAYLSFKNKTNKDFLIVKVKRLFLPVLFVVLTVGPLSGYILAITKFGFEGSFIQFYPHFFIDITKYLFWGHMWYCVYLFIFSVTTLPLLNLLKTKTKIVHQINTFLSTKNNIVLPMLIIVFIEFSLRPHYPGYQSFWGDWANVLVYLAFFLFGFVMCQSKDLIEVIVKKRIVFVIIALLSSIMYLYIKIGLEMTIALNVLWGIAAYSWTMFIIGQFKRSLNYQNKVLQFLSSRSFSLYIFHYLIIAVINLLLFKSNMHYLIIWIVTILSTYVVTFVFYKFVLTKFKLLRFICGIRVK